MSKPLCQLLKSIPSGTAVHQILMNGEDWSGIERFVKYDEKTDLAYFLNGSNHTFVALAKRIDMIEFTLK